MDGFVASEAELAGGSGEARGSGGRGWRWGKRGETVKGAGHRAEKKEQKSTRIEDPAGVKLWLRVPSSHPDNSASKGVDKPHFQPNKRVLRLHHQLKDTKQS